MKSFQTRLAAWNEFDNRTLTATDLSDEQRNLVKEALRLMKKNILGWYKGAIKNKFRILRNLGIAWTDTRVGGKTNSFELNLVTKNNKFEVVIYDTTNGRKQKLRKKLSLKGHTAISLAKKLLSFTKITS